jgi:hypothetical protein
MLYHYRYNTYTLYILILIADKPQKVTYTCTINNRQLLICKVIFVRDACTAVFNKFSSENIFKWLLNVKGQ